MRKKLFTFLLALVTSVGLMNAKVTWNSSNISNLYVEGTGSYSKEDVTLSVNADNNEVYWYHYGGNESQYGILFYIVKTGGYTFSNTLGKNFTKIEMFPISSNGWTGVNLGSGWSFSGENGDPVTWDGNASTVDLLKDVADFTNGENVKSIVFYFEGDSEEPATPVSPVTAARFVYNYDCQRSPSYPKKETACTLSGFKDPLEGYKGKSNGNIALGPWKLEFVAYYTPSNNYGCASQVNTAVYQYYSSLSSQEREAKKLDMPIFRLWQYNLTAREYQPATYGIVCAYAGEANAQDHAALFISSNSYGCFLSGHQHTTSFALTCENDLTTGLAALVTAASATDPDYDAYMPVIVSIDAIGPVELSEHCKYYIEGSRAAYNALTDEQKAQVTNYSTLTDAETQWEALAAVAQPYADPVIDLINAIPNPVVYTQQCKDAIDAAQDAYDALTDGQKVLVTNAETLPQATLAFFNAAHPNILFTADNDNIKRIEDVTLPKTFTAGYYDTNSELGVILKELYGINEDAFVGNVYSYNDTVTKSGSVLTVNPFLGTAKIAGYLTIMSTWTDSQYSVDITLELPPLDPTPTPSGDKLSGVFSVSADKAVNFSKGNLQYDSENQIWQFAANQWDYIGNAAGNNAITADGIADNNGIVDLFGWVGASSSWITGSTTQYGISTSTISNDYGNVYGEALKQDWGNTMGSDWRTLSKDEWNYLLTERVNAANLRTLATVNDKTGLILMPDGWTASGVSLTVTKENYTDNTIGSSDWATLAGQGCVFLPAAGSRNGTFVMSAGTKGHYWSSTSRSDGASLNSFKLVFMADDVDPTDYTNRYTGLSVRLVSETAPTPASANPVIKLNADFGGTWADTEDFTDNGNTASWSISTLTAGQWYHFGVKVDDTWTSDNAAFDREHPSRAISGTGDAMYFQADVAGEYTFTWEYATNTLTIGFPDIVPTVAMKGSWDGWTDEVNFSDNGNGTASVTKTFEHEGYYTFKTVLDGDDWRGNGEAFKRNYTGAEGITGNTDMTLWVDAKGEYTFTWTYASNRIDITYPALPTVYLYLNGSTDAFTNRANGTATYDIHFNSTGSYKEFKIRVGESDWRSNGQIFNPEHTTYDWINDNGGGAYMQIYVDAEADYTFTWTYVENKLEITHPVVPDYTVMTKVDPVNPGVYYSTFYSSNYSYKLMDDGTEAFIASISGGDLVLTQIAEGEQVIPAGTAVIFRKTGSSLPVGLRDTEENNTSFDPADNDLKGVDHDTPIADKGMTQDNCYVLSGTAQYGVGFYKINDTKLKQHKAYVKYEGGPNNAPKRMRFVYGQATSIGNVQGDKVQSTKVIENGQLFIIKNGVKYNAMGQIVK